VVTGIIVPFTIGAPIVTGLGTRKTAGLTRAGWCSVACGILIFFAGGTSAVFFALAQVLIALVIAARGGPGAWQSSAAWWMLSATVANVASFLLLRWRFTREGASHRDLWRFSRQTFWKGLALPLGGFVRACCRS
jgi:hypothetical protein